MAEPKKHYGGGELHKEHHRWLDENPGEVPQEARDAAAEMGYPDIPDEALRDLIEMDPDLLGDWDAFQ